MWAVAGPTFVAGALVLVVAGAPKVLDPGDLVRALRSIGVRAPAPFVRLFAGAEVAAGVAAIALPGRLSASAVALLHVAFTVFVLRALTKGGSVASCGCFGKADTPPTRAHALVTFGLALAAVSVAIAPPADPWWASGAAESLAVVGPALLIAFLGWQVMAVLPSTTPTAIRSTGRA